MIRAQAAVRQPFLWLGLWGLGIGVALALDDPRRHFPVFLVTGGVAIAAWLGLWHLVRQRRLSSAAIVGCWIAAMLARIWALGSAPAFSDDVFRHIYEGRLVWWGGFAFPFIHPPADGPALGVPAALLDASWLRINHPEIPTIYPPLATLVFALAALLGDVVGHLLALKTILVAAELGALFLLERTLARAGRPGFGAVLATCPVLILEVAREGHADSLSLFGLVFLVLGFAGGRPRLGYLGIGLAALAKLNGFFAAPAALRVVRRGAWVFVGLGALVLLPVFVGGLEATQAVGEYSSRWRTGDGVFSIFAQLAEWLLGGSWSRFGDRTITAAQLARAFTALAFVAGAGVLLWRPYPVEKIPDRAGALVLLFLLLTPTLHPWYVLWLVPFLPFLEAAAAPALALIALAWLGHHPGWLELSTGRWTDLGWVRAIHHGVAWSAWIAAVRLRPPA